MTTEALKRAVKKADACCPCANGQMCAGGANAATKKKWACVCRTPFLVAQDGWTIEPSSACLWPGHAAIREAVREALDAAKWAAHSDSGCEGPDSISEFERGRLAAFKDICALAAALGESR